MRSIIIYIRPAMQAPQLQNVGESKIRRIHSDVLLGNRGELVIVHRGREYRLRVTRNGKLILTA